MTTLSLYKADWDTSNGFANVKLILSVSTLNEIGAQVMFSSLEVSFWITCTFIDSLLILSRTKPIDSSNISSENKTSTLPCLSILLMLNYRLDSWHLVVSSTTGLIPTSFISNSVYGGWSAFYLGNTLNFRVYGVNAPFSSFNNNLRYRSPRSVYLTKDMST